MIHVESPMSALSEACDASKQTLLTVLKRETVNLVK